MEIGKPTWYEFFAGGGMARLGLGSEWNCVFSNEWSQKKAAVYRTVFGNSELRVCDIGDLTTDDLPGFPTLAWASFPCQDLSLAGNGAGLAGERSGTFRPFWKLMLDLVGVDRSPEIVVLENVVGTLTSHGGKDFTAIVSALSSAGYKTGALVIDARWFLPQSRPRLFFVGVQHDQIPSMLMLNAPSEPWHPKSLRLAVERLPRKLQDSWVWWNVPLPRPRTLSLADLIEDEPEGVSWHPKQQTEHILELMSPLNKSKVRQAQQLGGRVIGTVYRRTRPNEWGRKVQRAEVRFDQISGCLRTPVGGSSRQTIIIVEGRKIRTRLLSPREAARLMGVPEDYPLPTSYNEAYHLIGDGLAVPAVSWLNSHLLAPLAKRAYLAVA